MQRSPQHQLKSHAFQSLTTDRFKLVTKTPVKNYLIFLNDHGAL